MLFLLLGKPDNTNGSITAYKIRRYSKLYQLMVDIPDSVSEHRLELVSSHEHGLLYIQHRPSDKVCSF